MPDTTKIIDRILSKNLPFAVYRLPAEKQPVVLVRTSPAREFPIEKLNEQKGFVAAPFESYKTRRAFLIEPDLVAVNQSEIARIAALLETLPDKESGFDDPDTPIIDKTTYLKQARTLIGQMQNGKIKKVVLSRTVEKTLPADFGFGRFFNLLQQAYPQAFVYLFSIPGQGVWAGATPETFLSKINDTIEIMALAGTQKQPVHTWQDKEIEEQAFVVDFVEAQLKKLKIAPYKKSRTQTLPAGPVAHLCTRFHIPEKVASRKIGPLAGLLHPTPAVCGLPKETAWQLIAETERHDRRFYTGFLGPWQVRGTSKLFVNLRCARFTRQKITLYTGGGLTAASVPQKEWQETEDKSQTLLSVVEKMRNFAP
jgi:isochorismate synthase